VGLHFVQICVNEGRYKLLSQQFCVVRRTATKYTVRSIICMCCGVKILENLLKKEVGHLWHLISKYLTSDSHAVSESEW
jgi:hypothetical protein